MREKPESNDIKKDRSFFNRITDFSNWTKKTWFYVIIFLLITLATIYLFYRTYENETFLFNLVVKYFAKPVSSLRKVGWLLFLAFMAIQGILIPIPSELVLLSSGIIWGLFLGGTLGLIGSMLAGTVCYFISLKGGRPIVEKLIGKENTNVIDQLVKKYGSFIILISRAFPFMAFDPISYVSGLTKVDIKKYLGATFLGSIIRASFYAWLGSSLIPAGTQLGDLSKTQVKNLVNTYASKFNFLVLILIAVLGVGYITYQYILFPRFKEREEGSR